MQNELELLYFFYLVGKRNWRRLTLLSIFCFLPAYLFVRFKKTSYVARVTFFEVEETQVALPLSFLGNSPSEVKMQQTLLISPTLFETFDKARIAEGLKDKSEASNSLLHRLNLATQTALLGSDYMKQLAFTSNPDYLQFLLNVEFEALPETSSFSIDYTSKDPTKAIAELNLLAKLLTTYGVELKRGKFDQSLANLKASLTKVEQDLLETRQQMTKFENEELYDTTGKAKTYFDLYFNLLQKTMESDAELKRNRAALEDTHGDRERMLSLAKDQYMGSNLNGRDVAGSQVSNESIMDQTLFQSSRFPDELVKTHQDYKQALALYHGAISQSESLHADLKKIREQMLSVPNKTREYSQIVLETEGKMQLLAALNKEYYLTLVNQSNVAPSFVQLGSPQFMPPQSVLENKAKALALTIFCALLLPLLFFGIYHLIRGSVFYYLQIKRLVGPKYLGAVPLHVSHEAPEKVLDRNHRSRATMLAITKKLSENKGKTQFVSIASAFSNCGTSQLTQSFAVFARHLGYRVAIVKFDLHIGSELPGAGSASFVSPILDSDEIAIFDFKQSMHSYKELDRFMLGSLDEFAAQLQDKYDLVLMDCPPTSLFAYAELQKICHHQIYCVPEARMTTAFLKEQMVEWSSSAHEASEISVVLTCSKLKENMRTLDDMTSGRLA